MTSIFEYDVPSVQVRDRSALKVYLERRAADGWKLVSAVPDPEATEALLLFLERSAPCHDPDLRMALLPRPAPQAARRGTIRMFPLPEPGIHVVDTVATGGEPEPLPGEVSLVLLQAPDLPSANDPGG